jgi:hypothetical protein
MKKKFPTKDWVERETEEDTLNKDRKLRCPECGGWSEFVQKIDHYRFYKCQCSAEYGYDVVAFNRRLLNNSQ